MELNKLYQIYLESSGITTDSRKISKGSIFFALKGERFNGNLYASKALEAGANFAVVDEVNDDFINDNRIVVVEDVLTTLQELANHHRNQFDIPILALTGSNGKTTTKELIHAVLSTKYKVHYTKGNFNNHIGVPLTLLEMPSDAEIAVIEMGANHPLEIEFLCGIANPSHGLVTNVGKAHLEGFGGFKGVIKAKGEMYEYLAKINGVAFVNKEENHLIEMASMCLNKKVYASDIGLKVINKGVSPFLKVEFEDKEGMIDISTQLVGSYNYPNILTAITIGRYFDVQSSLIKKGIETYVPSNNRSQLIKKASNSIILDAYNANPSSMRAAINNFNEIKAEKKILIIGDMLELGDESKEEHEKIIELTSQCDFDNIITVGQEFKKVNQKSGYINIEDLIEKWDWSVYSETTFLIKGSRGIKLEKILEV